MPWPGSEASEQYTIWSERYLGKELSSTPPTGSSVNGTALVIDGRFISPMALFLSKTENHFVTRFPAYVIDLYNNDTSSSTQISRYGIPRHRLL